MRENSIDFCKESNKMLPLSSLPKVNIEDYLKTSEQASFPVGCSDFKEMVTSTNIFVDKTRLIKKIIDTSGMAIMITRPRGWGKTLSMSMLYYFFNREVNEFGEPLVPNPNRVLFEGGETTITVDNQ